MAAPPSVQGIAGLRIAIGVGAWATPRLAGKLFGLDPDHNPQSPYLARLFGIRDVALGVGALGSRGKTRRPWLVLGLACDVADGAAAVLSYRDGQFGPVSTALLVGTPLAAIGAGIAALRQSEAS